MNTDNYRVTYIRNDRGEMIRKTAVIAKTTLEITRSLIADSFKFLNVILSISIKLGLVYLLFPAISKAIQAILITIHYYIF